MKIIREEKINFKQHVRFLLHENKKEDSVTTYVYCITGNKVLTYTVPYFTACEPHSQFLTNGFYTCGRMFRVAVTMFSSLDSLLDWLGTTTTLTVRNLFSNIKILYYPQAARAVLSGKLSESQVSCTKSNSINRYYCRTLLLLPFWSFGIKYLSGYSISVDLVEFEE